MTFLEVLKQQIIVLDGATGTMIQDLELSDDAFGGPDYKMLSDLLVFARPDDMRNIHLAYLRAGANAIKTNTFGASPMRLSEYDFSKLDMSHYAPIPGGIDLPALSYEEFACHLSRRAAEIACEARDAYKAEADYDGRPLYIFGSIGPSNRVLSNTKADLVESTFEDVMDNFYHQVSGLIDGGTDVLLYETQQDILELKAAVMGGQKAMKDKGVRLPIIAQVTVDKFSKMQIFHTDIHAALVTLADIGIDVFGINCSIGPDLMEKTVETIARFSHLPISVAPNAGLPKSENGKTVFKLTPAELGDFQRKFVESHGVNIVGGCCGTTPAHIRAIVAAVKDLKPKERQPEKHLYVSGPQQAIQLDGSETLICFGERLNVRGSKKVRDAVENDTGIDQDVLEEVVREQVQDLGCEIIDVCMDSNTIDTVDTLKKVIHAQTGDFAGAMCLDSFQVDALEEAIKVYPGRPIINSISMEEAEPGLLKIDAVIRATQQHGPLYVGLCTGPKGPGATAAEKLDLANQIISVAGDNYGIGPERLFIDVNVFPIGSESEEDMNFALETLEAIAQLKAQHPTVNTTLGVGNLTNGLAKKPYMRKVLTSVFLDEARKRGLDGAIINPNHYVFVQDLDKKDYQLGLSAVMDRDMDAFAQLEIIAEAKKGVTVQRRTSYEDLPLEKAITEQIKDGFKQRKAGSLEFRGHTYEYADTIVTQVVQALEKHEPLDFINDYLMAAMEELGDGFGRGEVSLPHLLRAADVMRQAMGFLEAYMRSQSSAGDALEFKGTVVLGTVYQDVHSIGKDLTKTLLENYGYRVIDLGAMAPLQSFIDAAKEHNADAIGMSALLVQTSNHMITVAKMMKEQDLDIPVLVGGAPVSPRHAAYVAMLGQDDDTLIRDDVFYGRTAMDAVNIMNQLQSGDDLESYKTQNKDNLLKRLERARNRQSEEDALRKTLSRRAVSFENHVLPDGLDFRLQRYEYSLEEFAPHMDRKTLYSLNWRFGGSAAQARSGHSPEELDTLFNLWVEKVTKNDWLRPQGVMGLFPCYAEGDDVILCDPQQPEKELYRLAFSEVIGAERKDLICAAQYFQPKDSPRRDVMGVQLTCSGPRIDDILEDFKKEGDTEAQMMLQGLSDRVAEDLAELLHQKQRSSLGLAPDTGQRWSPGYPGMKEVTLNKMLLECVNGSELLGVKCTDAGEFSPTGATAAVVSFHPDARYT
jgi:5-methyltetrahydrofolate--homocysteine methyltransferase